MFDAHNRRWRSLRSSFLVALALSAAFAGADGADAQALQDARILPLRDAYGLEVAAPGAPEEAARSFIAAHRDLVVGARERIPDLRLVEVRESLGGNAVRFREVRDGLEVIGSDVVVTLAAGTVGSMHSRLPPTERSGRFAIAGTDALAVVRRDAALAPEALYLEPERVYVAMGESVRAAYRVYVEQSRLERFACYVDAESGVLFAVHPLFFNAEGRVFDPNPVVVLNDSALRDLDNSAGAIPSSAYAAVVLPDLLPSGPLAGPHVTIVDVEAPLTTRADAAGALSFDRSDPRFEEVMAYFHIDRAQRYLQSLGYSGARRIIDRAIAVDAHGAGGADNSYYVWTVPGRGNLFFGDGGTDDAEDGDIVMHEYGHAIQDAIAPGMFTGSYASQARALGEGFGDYWAYARGYAAREASGRDLFCIGDWDARCGTETTRCNYGPTADCLRRVDGSKTMDDYVLTEQRGVEHRNGEIWSSALREIHVTLVSRYGADGGGRIADSIILESHFGMPPGPTFNTAAKKIVEADRIVNAGSNADVICAAMVARKIMSAGECDATPRGETVLHQSPQQVIAIPDAAPAGIAVTTTIRDARLVEELFVQVDITHPHRGDLRIELTSPDGARVVLKAAGADAGRDVRVTYGIDAQAKDSLSIFRGRPADGVWTLTVVDTMARDTGVVNSFALLVRYWGDAPIETRAAPGAPTLVIPAVAHASGVAGTRFVSDVRLFNRSRERALLTAFLTPSGEDGTARFAAIRLAIDPGQIVALDDVVARQFHTFGVGALELRGDVDRVIATSRTYNDAGDRTYGQFIPAFDSREAFGSNDSPRTLPQLARNALFRSNFGVAETAGAAGEIEIAVSSATGEVIDVARYAIAAFSHLQMPLLAQLPAGDHDALRATVRVVSGAAHILAYASVVDNLSGDAIFIPGHPPSGGGTRTIPAVIHAAGAEGTLWRSDLWLTNDGDRPASASLRYRSAAGGPAGALAVTVPPRASLTLPDVVRSQFGIGGGAGQVEVSMPPLLHATSRTWTVASSGSFGQFIPSRETSEAIGIGETATAIGITKSARLRTNVGIAEVAGAETLVRFTFFDASGVVVGAYERAVPPFGLLQLNAGEAGIAAIANGRVAITVIGGSGAVLGYASVVDNVSGDPVYIPATR